MEFESLLDNGFRGAACLVQNREVLFAKASGFADLPNETPNTLETKFGQRVSGEGLCSRGDFADD